jgi:carboxyl-terminal processing protease
MKIYLSILLAFSAVIASAQMPDSVRQVLSSFIEHVETASLFREQVDWATIKPLVWQKAEGVSTVAGLKPAFDFLLEALHDEHGRVFYNNQQIAYYFGEMKPHQKGFDPALYGQIQQAQAYPFMASMLDKQTGYLRIVGLPMGDNQAMSKVIDDAVCDLVNKGAKHWVIDLRYNGGGNLNPMAEGIAGILGEGALGGSKGLTSAEDGEWSIRDGDFYNYGYTVQFKNGCAFKKLPKVAVLTSLYTASSGEALAVMFKGRQQTRFFGVKTLGMVTVTDWTVLNENTACTISVAYYRDRNGRVYDQFVDVDEELPFSPTNDVKNDACVKRALAWLCE